MKIKALIKELSNFDPEAEITISDPKALNGFREILAVEEFPFDDGVIIHLKEENPL